MKVMIYYKGDGGLYRVREDLAKQCEPITSVMAASIDAVRIPTEYAFSDFRSRSEVQIFVEFYGCLYQSVRGVRSEIMM